MVRPVAMARVWAWTTQDIDRMKTTMDNDSGLVEFVLWNCLPSTTEALLAQTKYPSARGKDPSCTPLLLRRTATCSVVPICWFVQRENEIISALVGESEPWLGVPVVKVLESPSTTLLALEVPQTKEREEGKICMIGCCGYQM